MEIPEVLEIKSIVKENHKTKTFFFYKKIEAEPGQFMMVWIPRMDEKPFAVSFTDPFGITVTKVGPFSSAMHQMYEGQKVGIRGPYGNGFRLNGKKICIVGGGYGIIPLSFLAEKAFSKDYEVTAIIGARNKDDLFFLDRLKKSKLIITTNDGYMGMKGFATDALMDELKKETYDCVYTCGPEVMMKKVFEICENAGIECQVSLERYMKCGFGICGQCCVDGLMVCKDGPVFNSEKLRKLSEFGVFNRDGTGTKVYF
jgi:dihydroorotate dehydrogenase electron transfer subunit